MSADDTAGDDFILDLSDLAELDEWDGVIPAEVIEADAEWAASQDAERAAAAADADAPDDEQAGAVVLPADFDDRNDDQRESWAYEPWLPRWEAKERRRLYAAWLADHPEADPLHKTIPAVAPDAAQSAATEDDVERLAQVRERFPVLDLAALVDPNRPARRELLAGMIPEGEHVSIVAPAGSGKSLLVEALVVAVIRGDREFLGRALYFPADNLVLVVDMENSEDDLRERLIDLGVTPENVAGFAARLLILHMPHLRGLDTRQGADELREVLDAYGMTEGDLLVLDSTQRVTEGDENAADTMRRLYNLTSAELKRRGITTVRTDNTGWGRDRERGSSAKRDDVGASWLLIPSESDPETFTLEPTKRRSKGTSEVVAFRRWSDDDGLLHFDPVASAVTAFVDSMRSIEALLDRLGVTLDMGHGKVWEAVTAERKRAEATHEAFPSGVTQRLVRRAHEDRRRAVQIVVDRAQDAADELPELDYDGDLT